MTNSNTTSFDISAKPIGLHQYRVAHTFPDCSGGGRGRCPTVTEHSEIITVQVETGPVPVPSSLDVQRTFTYEVRTGDIGGDGLTDVYVRRTSGGTQNDGVLYETILIQTTDGRLIATSDNPAWFDIARTWPVANVAVEVNDFNVDGHVDVFIDGLDTIIPTVSDQFIYSTGELYNGNARSVVGVADEMTMFFDDIDAWVDDPMHFDQAGTPDEQGYNIKIEAVVRTCANVYGFLLCADVSTVLFEEDIPLPDLGLDGFISAATQQSPSGVSIATAGATMNSEVTTKSAPVLSAHQVTNIVDLSAYSNAPQKAAAMIEVEPELAEINDPSTLRCVFWCGLIDFLPTWDGYIEVFLVDTWTPITIPGTFDDTNYSLDAFELSVELQKIIDQASDASIDKAKEILERVLGTVVGGWDLGDWLPGQIDPDTQDGYEFLLAITSTQDARTGETPDCIANNPNYYQSRLDNFLSPGSFVASINNRIDLSISEVLDNNTWSSSRYSFIVTTGGLSFLIDNFGFIDARHIVTAYKIGWGFGLFELLYETFQGCSSSYITEDIYSNHLGQEAQRLFDSDPSKTPGEHILDLIDEDRGRLAGRTEAVVTLRSEGANVN
ncbi:MAG: hypothetical protein AAGL69_10395 [Pseudomonadota bacterium]